MARHRVVCLVAMHVDHKSALGGDFAQSGDRPGAVVHGTFEMRDAADNVDAHVERRDEVLFGICRAVKAILREGDKLQIYVIPDLLADFQQPFDAGQAVVADINMGADRQEALRNGKIAVFQGALNNGLDGQDFLEFPPKRNSFEQRAAAVHAR